MTPTLVYTPHAIYDRITIRPVNDTYVRPPRPSFEVGWFTIVRFTLKRLVRQFLFTSYNWRTFDRTRWSGIDPGDFAVMYVGEDGCLPSFPEKK